MTHVFHTIIIDSIHTPEDMSGMKIYHMYMNIISKAIIIVVSGGWIIL